MRHDIGKWRRLQEWMKSVVDMEVSVGFRFTEAHAELLLRLPHPAIQAFPLQVLWDFEDLERLPEYMPEDLRDYARRRIEYAHRAAVLAMSMADEALRRFPLTDEDIRWLAARRRQHYGREAQRC